MEERWFTPKYSSLLLVYHEFSVTSHTRTLNPVPYIMDTAFLLHLWALNNSAKYYKWRNNLKMSTMGFWLKPSKNVYGLWFCRFLVLFFPWILKWPFVIICQMFTCLCWAWISFQHKHNHGQRRLGFYSPTKRDCLDVRFVLVIADKDTKQCIL